MRRYPGLLSIAGIFAVASTALAQAPAPPAAGTPFDGTYGFVSATKLSETFVGEGGRVRTCPDIKGGPLTIEKGQARYFRLTGTVGPRGDVALRASLPPTGKRGGIAYEVTLTGSIDSHGTVRARRSGYGCNYDFVWQKPGR
jgi:hypothetical protein